MTPQGNTWRLWLSIFVCLVMPYWVVLGQNPQNPRPPSPDEVVRVFTELVQTDVMVFNKQGQFVNGLTQADFQLKVDGKIRAIQAFELIRAGSDEEAQLAAARGASVSTDSVKPKIPVPLDRGRTVFFYLDDFHLDAGGFVAAKKAIESFVEKQMGQNDQVAITTATGQLGFLQQLTNNRAVLREAIERLKPRVYNVRDAERPPMSEYEALLIENNDFEVLDFFVTETIRGNPNMSRDTAIAIVKGRSRLIQSQAAALTVNMLSGLEKWVRAVGPVQGRKVMFLLSNGFFIENKHSDATSRLRSITSAAAKNGVVIYSLDTRGLVADLNDIAVDRAFDPSGRLLRATNGQLFASQNGLNALAKDTGGRALFNTNDSSNGLSDAVKETSIYYLLAWKPESDEQKPGRFRNIEVSVVGKTDLSVRVRRGFFDVDPTPTNVAELNKVEASKAIPEKLRESIIAPFPQNALPIRLGAVYYDLIDKGPMISASIQMPGEFLTFGPQDGKIQAIIDLTGVFCDDRGVPIKSFLERIVTTAPDAEAAKGYRRDITYMYPLVVRPGLFQVRVAARDEKSGRVGSAYAWVSIPDLSTKKLAMSSLLLGERTQAMMTNVSDPTGSLPIALSASHRFRRESNLRLLIFSYNTQPSPTDGKPDVAVQVQVIRDDQPVITTALRKVSTEGTLDLARLPYAAEIPLTGLTTGQYILQVTVIDRLSKQSVSQQTHFEVY